MICSAAHLAEWPGARGWCYDPCRLSFWGRSLRVGLFGDRNVFAAPQVMIRVRPHFIGKEMNYLAFALCVLMLSVSSSFGQYASVIQACTGDFMKFCAAGQHEAGSPTQCVKAHFEDFTEHCKAALVRIAAVHDACGTDIKKQCPTTKPGAGRIFLCVKQHFSVLSEPCKEAIGKAAERK
jgi:hypothetical protein